MAGLNYSWGGIAGAGAGAALGPLGLIGGYIAGQKAGQAASKALGIKNDPSYLNFGSPATKKTTTRKSDPTQGATPQTPTNTWAGTGYGGGSGGGTSAYNPADLAYLDDQEARLRGQQGSADRALNTGLTELNDSYGREVSKANANQSRALQKRAQKLKIQLKYKLNEKEMLREGFSIQRQYIFSVAFFSQKTDTRTGRVDDVF